MTSNQSSKYDLYFSGKITENANVQKITLILSKSLKISEPEVHQFFKGSPTKILNNISYERATDIQKKMLMIGAICEIEEQKLILSEIEKVQSKTQSVKSTKARDIFNKYSYIIFFIFISFILQYKWDFAIILTFIATILFVHPILIDKMNFLSPYYGNIDFATKIKIKLLKQAAICFLEIIFISLAAINFAAYEDSDFIIITYFFFLILSYQILKYRLKKFDNNYLQTMRVFYFKDSLKLGILFSIISLFFPEKGLISSGFGAFGGNVADAVSALNAATMTFASLMPFPIDIILKIMFNMNVLAGFVLNAITIFIYSMNEILFGAKRELFLWKALLADFFGQKTSTPEQNINKAEEQTQS